MVWFDGQKFENFRIERGVTWGRPARILEETDSTNEEALRSASSDAKTGIVWVAREQTMGRGRRGNSWDAPPGEGLTFSTLLRYEGPFERLYGASLAVGLAVHDVVEQAMAKSEPAPDEAREVSPHGLAQQVAVKWPNDVYVGARKVAGILVETRQNGPGRFSVVVGVGLNVHMRAFPESLPSATSLALEGVPEGARCFESLLVDLMASLERRFMVFFARGIGALVSDLRDVDYLLGRAVTVGEIYGTARGFDELGRLLLEKTDGKMIPVESGHVDVAVASLRNTPRATRAT